MSVLNKTENYYKIGGILKFQHPTYVKRQADDELYDGLKQGEYCYVLNSRQMGKGDRKACRDVVHKSPTVRDTTQYRYRSAAVR